MLLLIDNYDSFIYNLKHYFGELGADVVAYRNDALSAGEALALKPEAIYLSPGPCEPDQAGICLDLVAATAGRVPLVGVCLGFQAIGQAFGGRVVRAPKPMHGKLSPIHHNGQGLFETIENPFSATRYHSLILARENWPEALEITAETEDGIVMGIRHKTHLCAGVQFHPESIASEHGHRLLENFLKMAGMAGITA
ncbi:MAG: aminodeoxychorismate/anthranilate synthase component II [Rhodospirillales bacterium]